jgi:hypothetical protein
MPSSLFCIAALAAIRTVLLSRSPALALELHSCGRRARVPSLLTSAVSLLACSVSYRHITYHPILIYLKHAAGCKGMLSGSCPFQADASYLKNCSFQHCIAARLSAEQGFLEAHPVSLLLLLLLCL